MSAVSRFPRLVPILAALAGLALLVVVLLRHDLSAIVDAIGWLGWGFIPAVAVYLLPLLADTVGWRHLFPQTMRPKLTQALAWRWIGQSVNGFLPTAQVGGDVVRARLAVLARTSVAAASASVVADILVGLVTQVVFAALGLMVLVSLTTDLSSSLAVPILGGFAVMTAVSFGAWCLFRSGLLSSIAERISASTRSGLQRLHDGVVGFEHGMQRTLNDRRALATAAVWRLSGWSLGAVEVWVGFWLLGHPVSWLEAFFVESIIQAVRTAVFFIPNALGVQETVLALLGTTLGLTPETGLALSLVRRLRELCFGVPGLIAWQIMEGRHSRASRHSNRCRATHRAPHECGINKR